MKKLFALMMVLVLCLSLCACDKDAAQKLTTNTQSGIGQNENSLKEEIKSAMDKFRDHVLLSQIYGTWTFEKWGDHNHEYNLYKNLVINQDGTCAVDGVPAVWKISEDQTRDDTLVILIYVENVCAYGASFHEYTDVDGNPWISLLAFEGEHGALAQTTFNHQS